MSLGFLTGIFGTVAFLLVGCVGPRMLSSALPPPQAVAEGAPDAITHYLETAPSRAPVACSADASSLPADAVNLFTQMAGRVSLLYGTVYDRVKMFYSVAHGENPFEEATCRNAQALSASAGLSLREAMERVVTADYRSTQAAIAGEAEAVADFMRMFADMDGVGRRQALETAVRFGRDTLRLRRQLDATREGATLLMRMQLARLTAGGNGL